MEHTTFEISDAGSVVIKGYGYGRNTVTVETLTGWDDAELDIQTAEKLNGNGSYILSERVAERTIVAGFSLTGDVKSGRFYTRSLNSTLLSRRVVSVTVTHTENGVAIYETVTGKIKAVKPIYGANEQKIEVTLLLTAVEKTINDNGIISINL